MILSRFAFPAAIMAALAACSAPPPTRPADARPDLAHKWLTPDGNYAWPPADGFAGPPVFVVLPPGTLIDRFGDTTGHYLSPHGAGFDSRALPYQCAGKPYTVYRVVRPLPAWVGKVAAWFDRPGGATQFETDASVAMLLADRTIEPVAEAGPSPC